MYRIRSPSPIPSFRFHPTDLISTSFNCLHHLSSQRVCGLTRFLFGPRRTHSLSESLFSKLPISIPVFPISVSASLLYSQAGKLLHLRGAPCPTLGMTFLP